MLCHQIIKLAKKRLILTGAVLLIVISAGAYIVHAIQPCPVVTDTTIAQMAQNWAGSLTSPFTKYLEDKYSLLLKQKTMPGIWGQGEKIYGLYKQADDVGGLLERELKAIAEPSFSFLKKIPGINMSSSVQVHDSANKKLGTLQAQTTAALYTRGKNAFKLANDTEAFLKQFSPLQFDFASKSQVQKDMVKIARIQARTQAEILSLISSMKIHKEFID